MSFYLLGSTREDGIPQNNMLVIPYHIHDLVKKVLKYCKLRIQVVADRSSYYNDNKITLWVNLFLRRNKQILAQHFSQ